MEQQLKTLKYPNLINAPMTISSKSPIMFVIEDIRKVLNPSSSSKNISSKAAVSSKKGASKKKHHHINKKSESCLEMFKQSCFGTLFSMKKIRFNSSITHHLLLRQVMCSDLQVMEFNFNGKGARFTKQEFGLITGLNCKSVSPNGPCPKSDRILNTYFNGNRRLKNSHIKHAFLNTTEFEEENDLLKLGLLYFLECGILGKDSEKFIDIEHLSMVDNLDYFNSYPWGITSYNMTIHSLHKAFRHRDGATNTSNTYSLSGFPLAFQVFLRTCFNIYHLVNVYFYQFQPYDDIIYWCYN